MDAGARFERDPVAIVLDWACRPRRLAKAYKPGVGLRAPRAFLARSFRYDLDDEKRLVGGIVVQTSWVRRQKRDGRPKRDQPLTEDGVEAAQNEARRKMTHRPPAGSMNSTMLAEKLRDRQEGGKLAVALAATKPRTPEYEDMLAELHEKGFLLSARKKRAETNNAPPPPQDITFERACEVFWETKAVTRLKFTTRRGYEVSIDTYLLPRWKNLPIGRSASPTSTSSTPR